MLASANVDVFGNTIAPHECACTWGETSSFTTLSIASCQGDADAFILRDDSAPEEEEALYTEVTEEEELAACAKAFADLLDGEDILLET